MKKGIKLNKKYADLLKSQGINWIYIEDPLSEDIDVEDIIHDETRVFANTLLAEILSHNPPVINRNTIMRLKDAAIMIVSDIKEYRPRVTMELWFIKTLEDYLYLHSVNVAVISVMAGWHVGLSQNELEELCIAVLLHDLGKVTVDTLIHNKPGRLTEEEYMEMQLYTRRGFNILKDYAVFSPKVWSVALQHHEFYDGSGYPLGKKAKEIYLYSRITSIVDIFDALTSDRPYKKGWPFHKALNYLNTEVNKRFDEKVLRIFNNMVPQYPRGTAVTLSTGEIGMVVENIEKNYHRPIVRIMMDKKGNALGSDKVYDVDLSGEMDIQILDDHN